MFVREVINRVFYSIDGRGDTELDAMIALSGAASIVPDGFVNEFMELSEDDPRFRFRADIEAAPDVSRYYQLELADFRRSTERVQEKPLNGRADGNNAVPQYKLKRGVIDLGMHSARIQPLQAALERYLGAPCLARGYFYYPPGAFREWHTNRFHAAGWRLYFVHADAPQRSFFRFIDPETRTVRTIWDEPGTINLFRLDPARPLWHSVRCIDTNRWSQGFLVPEACLQRFDLTGRTTGERVSP